MHTRPPAGTLCSLARLRLELNIDPTLTGDDELLRDYLLAASEDFEGRTDRAFLPYVATQRARLTPSGLYAMPDDLLAAWSAQTDEGVSVSLERSTGLPILIQQSSSWLRIPEASALIVLITGIWGYEDRFAPLGQTVSLTDSASVLTVGATAFGKIQVDDTLRVGADEAIEYLTVTGKTTPATIAVTRGERGTLAQAHTDAPLARFSMRRDVVDAVSNLARQSYMFRDIGEERRIEVAGGVVTYGEGIKQSTRETIKRYRRLGVTTL